MRTSTAVGVAEPGRGGIAGRAGGLSVIAGIAAAGVLGGSRVSSAPPVGVLGESSFRGRVREDKATGGKKEKL